MTSAAIRDRLYSLWSYLNDPRTDRILQPDSVVPSRFLTDNNITLTQHTFSALHTAAENLAKQPPVLFLRRPATIITDHPINPNTNFFSRVRVDPSPTVQLESIFSSESMPFYRGVPLARYLDNWAMGGYPRLLPHNLSNLAMFCGIHGIGTPHAMNAETRGFLRDGGPTDMQWETYIYEHTQRRHDGSTVNPHLILLAVQSCNGIDNTISLGELTTIVTAMRCRAYQPAVFNGEAVLVGDVEQSEDGNPMPDDERKLAFKDEKRFPVIMVSLVGPQHARVIYACMDGLELCLRISPCYKIDAGSDGMVHRIASVLLSSPLNENDLEQD